MLLFKINFFVKSLYIYFSKDQLFTQFLRILILRSNVLMSEWSLKSYKKRQNNVPTKDGVIWNILKVTKIRDQGMDLRFLCYVFKYVPVVWVRILGRVFVFFINSTFLWEVWKFAFWGQTLNLFLGFLILGFEVWVKIITSKSQKVTKAPKLCAH